MSGKLHQASGPNGGLQPPNCAPSDEPLMTPDQASKLLEEVIYERVVSFIDTELLFAFEQELWFAYDVAGCADEEDVPMIVKALIDRALMRFCDDPRRYIDIGGPADLDDDCELCEQLARESSDATAKQRKTS